MNGELVKKQKVNKMNWIASILSFGTSVYKTEHKQDSKCRCPESKFRQDN